MAGNILHLRTRVAAAKAQLTDATVCLWISGNQNIARPSFFCITPVFNIYLCSFFFEGMLYLVYRTYMSITKPNVSMPLQWQHRGGRKGVEKKERELPTMDMPFLPRQEALTPKNMVGGSGGVGLSRWVFEVSPCAKTRFLGESFGRRIQDYKYEENILEHWHPGNWTNGYLKFEKVSPFEHDFA